MSVASRIQEIETHIGDIYDTLEVGGTDLTDLNKNIVNINSSLKDRYKYFLNNGVEVIWNNWEKVIGEGTEFTLENTIQAPMKVNLKGNTYQKSTTGKNLFDISKVLNNGTRVVNNGDGTLSVQAYGSSGGAPSYLKTYCPNLKVGDNVILTLETTSTNKFIYLSGTNQSWKSGVEITITQSDLDSSVLWYSNNNSTPATISNIMVRLSSITDDTYEPYTGGIPSPNPDYPQDIQVVSGDNTIEVVGKNLAPTDWATDFISRINDNTKAKLQIEDNRNCLFYTASAGYQEYDTKYMFKTNWKENTQYTFSFYMKSTANAGNIAIAYTDGTTQTFNDLVTANTWSKAVMTSNANKTIKRLQIYWTSGSSYIDLNTFMVEEGNQATTYEPYQKESYPINLGDIELCEIGDYQDDFIRNSGKNLFDKNNYNSYDGYISGTGTVNIVSAANNNIVYIDCLPNTQYTVSKRLSQRFRIGYSIDAPNSNVVVYGTLNGDSQTSLTITTGSDAKYLVIYLRNGNLSNELSLETILNSLQLERGEQATTYEPYGTGKWYLHKEIGKVVLDGSESWGAGNLQGSHFSFFWVTDIIKLNTKTELLIMSDMFTGYANPSEVIYNDVVGITTRPSTSGQGIYLRSNLTTAGTGNFKNWLSTHNTKVYYVLATPTYTEITDTTLLSQLEAIYKAISHDDQTNISQVNNDIPFKLEATALKNI